MKMVRNIFAPFLAIAFVAFLATNDQSWLVCTIYFGIVTLCADFLHKKGGWY